MSDGSLGQSDVRQIMASESDGPTSGKVTGSKLLALVESQAYRCAMSGVELTPKVASLDHVVPLSAGGSASMENIQILHEVVNRMKGTMSADEFIGWCRAIADTSRKSRSID